MIEFVSTITSIPVVLNFLKLHTRKLVHFMPFSHNVICSWFWLSLYNKSSVFYLSHLLNLYIVHNIKKLRSYGIYHIHFKFDFILSTHPYIEANSQYYIFPWTTSFGLCYRIWFIKAVLIFLLKQNWEETIQNSREIITCWNWKFNFIVEETTAHNDPTEWRINRSHQ